MSGYRCIGICFMVDGNSMKKSGKILLTLLAVLLLFVLAGFYNALVIRHYTVDVPGLERPVRIALITDLHSCSYGESQR